MGKEDVKQKIDNMKVQLSEAKTLLRDTIMPNRTKSSPGPIARRLSDFRPLEKIMQRRMR